MIEFTLPSLLEVAKDAAIKAGSALIDQQNLARQVHYSKERDVKIIGDTLSETIILDYLQLHSSFPILSEEAGIIGEINHKKYIWIVDPLDGSYNLSRNIPFYCISIGLWKGNEPILGVILNLTNDDIYSGIVGKGAYVNKKGINVSCTNQCTEAILCTGFPLNYKFSKKNILKFSEYVQIFKKIRLFGSAALSLSYVSAGVVDAYAEENIMIWDVAAGIAIVMAAGGEVKYSNGSVINSLNVLATNGALLIDK